MKVTEPPLTGLLLIEPKTFSDTRGFFFESFQTERFKALGIPAFVQDNFSRSTHSVLRGLHFQNPQAQGKLVGVTRGAVWDVAVDIRRSSKTFGQWFGVELNDENHAQLYIPPGFAHGFCVLSPIVDFYYKCTDFYAPSAERGIAWNDPALDIPWPITEPLLSPKDTQYPVLKDVLHEHLFA